jgi:hypothetical protein
MNVNRLRLRGAIGSTSLDRLSAVHVPVMHLGGWVGGRVGPPISGHLFGGQFAGHPIPNHATRDWARDAGHDSWMLMKLRGILRE